MLDSSPLPPLEAGTAKQGLLGHGTLRCGWSPDRQATSDAILTRCECGTVAVCGLKPYFTDRLLFTSCSHGSLRVRAASSNGRIFLLCRAGPYSAMSCRAYWNRMRTISEALSQGEAHRRSKGSKAGLVGSSDLLAASIPGMPCWLHLPQTSVRRFGGSLKTVGEDARSLSSEPSLRTSPCFWCNIYPQECAMRAGGQKYVQVGFVVSRQSPVVVLWQTARALSIWHRPANQAKGCVLPVSIFCIFRQVACATKASCMERLRLQVTTLPLQETLKRVSCTLSWRLQRVLPHYIVFR